MVGATLIPTAYNPGLRDRQFEQCVTVDMRMSVFTLSCCNMILLLTPKADNPGFEICGLRKM